MSSLSNMFDKPTEYRISAKYLCRSAGSACGGRRHTLPYPLMLFIRLSNRRFCATILFVKGDDGL